MANGLVRTKIRPGNFGPDQSIADPGIFVWEGGWGSRPDGQKTALTTFFSYQLILQFTERVQWFHFRENYTIPRLQRGSNNFQGGGGSSYFQGVGVQMLIYIETHITCDFLGGVRTPYPPVDPRMIMV